MNIPAKILSRNRRTIQAYEGYAEQYDKLVSALPPPNLESGLHRLIASVSPTSTILEIGSGPGRDADFIESFGVNVRRTDATEAFLRIQVQRGKHGDLLNVLTDDLGGPYDGVLALCVLIHIDRNEINQVLARIACALRPGGVFLVSLREGQGETTDAFHTVLWKGDDFAERLALAGLAVQWDETSLDEDGDRWITFFARRTV